MAVKPLTVDDWQLLELMAERLIVQSRKRARRCELIGYDDGVSYHKNSFALGIALKQLARDVLESNEVAV